jgi:hypothetical protein
MLDVVDMFKEKETRDELGIGVVRDGFADLLFPGTGTVQTRARYFLFIPWIYMDLERREVPSSEIALKARREEVALIDSLARTHPGRGEGVIGITAREDLQRLPSNIYWLGLGAWGIRGCNGSQEHYHRSLDRYYRAVAATPDSDDGEAIEHRACTWHTGIPDPPEDFPQKASFRLRRNEAGYLRDRIMTRVPNSLLAFLVDKGNPGDEADFPWKHPRFGQFPVPIREQLAHARNFSESSHGAALLSNLMLAQRAKSSALVQDYQERLKRWAVTLDARHQQLNQWDRKRFWEIVRKDAKANVRYSTQSFIDRWLDLVLNEGVARNIASHTVARGLIHDRERALKHGLARLDNRRALELWNGAAGTGQLDFRWAEARTITGDILKALKGGRNA